MKKILSVFLALYFVLSVCPISSSAANSQKAMFLFKNTLYVSCNVSSHAYKESYPYRKPIDIIDNVSGKGNAYAPVDCKVVVKDTSQGNTVAFESLNKVYFADGTYNYMTFMLSHDNDISNISVGKTFNQGDVIYQEGNAGTSAGIHIHLEVAKGAYSKRSSSSQSIWSFIRSQSNVKYPHEAFFLYSGTKISKSGGYTWVYANEYTLTYNANGGLTVPASQTGASSYTITSTQPTPQTGYTFLGWSTSSSATSASYTSGDKITLSANTTLYAVYRKNTLKVYYNANGGSISSDEYKLSSDIIYKKSDSTKYYQSWTYNSAKSNGLINPSTFGLSRSGYSFAGWGTSSSGGTIFDQNNTDLVPTNLTSNIKNGDCSITLYAQWKKNTYTLTYNANGGSNPPSPQSGSTSYTIPSTKPTKSGYTFLGWSTNSSATSASYIAGNKITLSSNATLYAVWEKNPTGSKPAAPTVSISSTSVIEGESVTLTWTAVPNVTNYWVSGFRGDERVIGEIDNSRSKKLTLEAGTYNFSVVAINSYGETTGNWVQFTVKEKTYTLTYNANGGSNPPSNQSGSTSYTISSIKPTKSGYTFLGWSTSSSATSAGYTAGDKITLSANTTLYAVWEKIPVIEAVTPTIKIKNNPETTTIKYGDILHLTAETTNMPEGAFVAWYYNGTEGAFEYGKSDDTLTCAILSIDNGSTTITAVVVDKNGNPILDTCGNEISDSQTIKSKAGFWQILISLFKTLFGLSRIIVQSANKII